MAALAAVESVSAALLAAHGAGDRGLTAVDGLLELGDLRQLFVDLGELVVQLGFLGLPAGMDQIDDPADLLVHRVDIGVQIEDLEVEFCQHGHIAGLFRGRSGGLSGLSGGVGGRGARPFEDSLHIGIHVQHSFG